MCLVELKAEEIELVVLDEIRGWVRRIVNGGRGLCDICDEFEAIEVSTAEGSVLPSRAVLDK